MMWMGWVEYWIMTIIRRYAVDATEYLMPRLADLSVRGPAVSALPSDNRPFRPHEDLITKILQQTRATEIDKKTRSGRYEQVASFALG